jgi:methionine aminopeptidase
VNEVICHGIPDRRPLQEGDIVNGKKYVSVTFVTVNKENQEVLGIC